MKQLLTKQEITDRLKKLEAGTIALEDISHKSLDASIIEEKANAELIHHILKKNGLFLSKISFSEFKKSSSWNSMYQLWFPCIIAAMKQNGLALQYTNDTFKCDIDIVSLATFQNPAAFCHADRTLRQSYDSIKSLLKINGLILQYINTDNYELLSCAVDQNPHTIKYIPEKFRTEHADNYEKFVLMAVGKNGTTLQYVSKELQDNFLLVQTAVNQNSGALYYALPKFKNDPSIVSFAVTQDGTALEAASPEMQDNEDIVALALAQNPGSLKYASKRIQENPSEKIMKSINFNKKNAGVILHHIKHRETLLKTVKDRPKLLVYLDTTFQKDKSFLTELLEHTWTAFEYIDEKFKYDLELIEIVFKQDMDILEHVPETLKNNKDFMLNKVSRNGLALQYIGKDLKGNKDIVRTAIATNVKALRFLPFQLRDDEEFMLELISQYPQAQEYVSSFLREEPEFISGLEKLKKSSRLNLLSWIVENKGGKQDSTGSNNSNPTTESKFGNGKK